MAKKSSLKRLRQIRKRTLRNKALRTALKTVIKRFEDSLAQKAPDAESKLRLALRVIDRARTKGILHRNTAARKKSRLMRKFSQSRSQAS
ncbi:30S ribosomal protein S20 [Desulfothermobacter acidiphilus]|uniref:30S ribosomal protein S20 n=1 Tax=Desulfothermobacter acidiphilus TaxID=1938353 RepID=UPI003F8B3E72